MHEILCLDKLKNTVSQVEITSVPELLADENNILWINFENPPNVWPDKQEMNLLTNVLHIHKLSIEDCIVEMHRPKIEEFSNYLLMIIYEFKRENKLKFHDIELILGKNYVISYTHEKIDEIESVKNSFKSCNNSLVSSSLDIFYLIIDHLIDNYLPVIDNFDIQIGKIEESLFKDPSNTKYLKQLNGVRACMNTTRQIIVLENEIFYNIIKKHYNGITDDKLVYFRDVYDHLEKDLAKIESLKESISNLLGIQMNINAQNLNEVMKFLTVISTILLPANLIAAFFGMNFDNIPFIHTNYGIITAVMSMVLFGLIMVVYFKQKKWI
jgi:magnesium transporter